MQAYATTSKAMQPKRHYSDTGHAVRESRLTAGLPVYIYALCDPRNGAVRYVGKSVNPKVRYRQYCSPSQYYHHRSHCSTWCFGLLQRGLRPILKILEVCPPGSAWWQAEQWWIAYGRSNGWQLTNHSIGGELGGLGVRRSSEFRQRVSRALMGRSKPVETRHLMAVAATGRVLDDATRAKIGSKNRGRSPSAATREKLRQARLGKSLSPEGRKKVGLAQHARIREPWELERLRQFGLNMSEETRRNMAAAKIGRKLPLSVRQKMSASHKRLHADQNTTGEHCRNI